MKFTFHKTLGNRSPVVKGSRRVVLHHFQTHLSVDLWVIVS